MLQTNQINDFIIENEIATQDEVDLCGSVAGFSPETMNAIIYARTGYHDIEQLYACERRNFYFNSDILGEIR